jgi:hypothetical protein
MFYTWLKGWSEQKQGIGTSCAQKIWERLSWQWVLPRDQQRQRCRSCVREVQFMSGAHPTNENLEAVYAQLNQQQKTTLAQEFIKGFQRAEDSGAAEFTSLDPKKVTPQQLAAMHHYARTAQPAVLGRVMRHPIVAALLGNFGTHEITQHVANRTA